MSTHFCKIGKTRPNLNKIFNLKNLHNKNVHVVEVISKQNDFQDLDVLT